jgi:hypothetical protein
MADYHCWPLWQAGEEVGNLNPEMLPISDDLKQKLLVWAEQYDQTLKEEDPRASGFADAASLDAFENEGQRLWNELRNQLGEQYKISYFSEKHHHLLNEPFEVNDI